jgi:hypothetical protein
MHSVVLLKPGVIAIGKKPTNSSVWNDLLKVRDLYVKGRVMVIGDGKRTDY